MASSAKILEYFKINRLDEVVTYFFSPLGKKVSLQIISPPLTTFCKYLKRGKCEVHFDINHCFNDMLFFTLSSQLTGKKGWAICNGF